MEDVAKKLLETHGMGKLVAPVKPEHWENLKSSTATSEITLEVENRFYTGYSHSELDWTRPVHAIFVDFKGDSLQLGKLVERLSQQGEQFVFVGNPAPFNGGWHFTAVNDFEHPDQNDLDPTWLNLRIWSQVNYVPSLSESGEPALTPREVFVPDRKQEGAIPVGESMKFTHLYFTGGLMAHTLVANAIGEGLPMSLVLSKHLAMGSIFATIGHGLDVLISCGTTDKSMIEGFTVAVFPKQDNLLKISGLVKSTDAVCEHRHATGSRLISASHWCAASAESWFQAIGCPDVAADSAAPLAADKFLQMTTTEPILHWEMVKMPNVDGAVFKGATGEPRIAVFCDDVADTMEIYTVLTKLMEANLNFLVISHSRTATEMDVEGSVTRDVKSEIVFGNAMYPLRDCLCSIASIPADAVPASFRPDAFFAVGGQCPYRMIQDEAITSIIQKCKIACAVCHGPELLLGTKWLQDGEPYDKFISYYGAWMSFREFLSRYDKRKPGEICVDSTGCLLTGNAPNSTPALIDKAVETIQALASS